MRLLAALEPDQLETGAIVAIVVLGVLALVVARFIQKLILKLVMVVALVGVGVFVYVQRDDLDECQRRIRSVESVAQEERCTCTFAGFDVKVPGCAALPVPGSDG